MLAVATSDTTHKTRLLVYTTKTAGRAWSAHPVPADHGLHRYLTQRQPILFSAPDARDPFVFLSGTLYKSRDGGRTWTRLPKTNLSGFASLDFVSADYGWIRTTNHFDYTIDRGRHRKPIGS